MSGTGPCPTEPLDPKSEALRMLAGLGGGGHHDPLRSSVDVVSEMSMFLGEVRGHALRATK